MESLLHIISISLRVSRALLLLVPGFLRMPYIFRPCSAVVEDPCTSVVGASGGIYGLVGMYIMEFILDWKVLKR